MIQDQFAQVRDEADVLVVAGDLTNYGKPEEMEPLLNSLVRLRLPIIAVLGNHDYESGRQAELTRMMTDAGIKLLDGTAYERDGVGFAGTKGFPGGFGRGALTAFGEPEVKAFVQAAIDEALKLERAMSQLRTAKRVVLLHYAPIGDTIRGEAPEIYPYLGSSRLAEVIDRHGADIVVSWPRPSWLSGWQDYCRHSRAQRSHANPSKPGTAHGFPNIRGLSRPTALYDFAL